MRTIQPPHRIQAPSGRRILTGSGLLAICAALLFATEVKGVDANLDVGEWALDSTSRVLPATVPPVGKNTAVDIGTFTFTGGTGSLVIAVNASGKNWSVAKRYVIPMRYNLWSAATTNIWLKVLPAHDTGPTGVNNFDLDIRVVKAVMNVRLRVSGTNGVDAATANIAVESTGVSVVSLAPKPNEVVTPPTATETFAGSVLTQVNGRVGVNTVPAAGAALDINGGDTGGLRIRPMSAAGFTAGRPASGTWIKGTLIVDSSGILHVCIADGAPGTWKKVGAP